MVAPPPGPPPAAVPPSPAPGPASDAASRVKIPAIGLIATGGIGALLALLGLALNLLGVGLGAAGGGDEGFSLAAQGALGILQSVVGLAMSGLIVFGGLKMMKLQSYGLCMAAAVLSFIPFLSPCCLLGLVFGIWSLVVLNNAEIKAAFR